MPLSRRWTNYQTDDLYRAWRAGRLSYNAFDAYAVSAAAEILSNIYSTATGGSLGPAERIEKDFQAQAIMKMLKELDVLVAQAEAGTAVFADEPEPKAPAEPKTDPRQETPEERAAEAGLIKHPSAEPETLGRSCKGCAFYKPAGKPKGRGQCTNAYVKQPVAADWYCKHWKAAQAAPDGRRVKAALIAADGQARQVFYRDLPAPDPKDPKAPELYRELQSLLSGYSDRLEADEVELVKQHLRVLQSGLIKNKNSKTAVFDLDGTIIKDPETFPGFGVPDQDIVARMQQCLDAGIEVLVHSCRWSAELNDQETADGIKAEVETWLRENKIPFSALYAANKPMAVFYCDDRSVHPSDLARLDRLIAEAAEQVKEAPMEPEHLPGSKHWNDPDDKYDAKALAQGVEIELEHTTDRELAKQIAKDHLSEDPQYYEKLKKVEAGLLFKAGDGKYWIAPDGKLFDVPHSHTGWIEDYPDKWETYDTDGKLSAGLDAIDEANDPETINEQLFYQAEFVSQGWTRVDGDSIDTTAAKLKIAQNFAREVWLKDDREKKIYVDFQGEGYFQGTVKDFVRLKTIKGAQLKPARPIIFAGTERELKPEDMDKFTMDDDDPESVKNKVQRVIDLIIENDMASGFNPLPGFKDSREMIQKAFGVYAVPGGSPEDAFQVFEEDFARAYEEVSQFLESGTIKLYRMIQLNHEDAKVLVESLKKGKLGLKRKGLGIYWSHNEAAVDAYHGEGGSNYIVLKGEAPTSSVDWVGSLLAQVQFGDEEDEIRLKAGAPVTLTGLRWNYPGSEEGGQGEQNIEVPLNLQLKAGLSLQASDGKFEWSCLMVDYPQDLAKRVMAWGADNIPDDVIYDPEADRTFGREKHIHTTVAYGIEPEVKLSDIKSALGDRLGLVKAKLGKVTKFATNPDYDVIKIDVLSPDLHALHQAVEDTIGAPGNSFPEYKPHLTIAYVKPGSCDHLLDTSPFEGEEFELSDFDFSDPNSSHEKFKVTAARTRTKESGWGTYEPGEPVALKDLEVGETYMRTHSDFWRRKTTKFFTIIKVTDKQTKTAQNPVIGEYIEVTWDELDPETLSPRGATGQAESWSSSKGQFFKLGKNLTAMAAPQGVRVAAKMPFRSILFTAAPLLNRLAKLAKEAVESDPAFQGYQADPAKAERLGAIQQNLSDARSEEELRQAWDAAGLGTSFDELRQRAENLSE